VKIRFQILCFKLSLTHYVSEIQVVSGVRIKVSDRGDFVEGTRNRKVTLTGTQEGVQIAQYLLAQKLRSSTAPGQ
jgi:RNA-binding protein Nova